MTAERWHEGRIRGVIRMGELLSHDRRHRFEAIPPCLGIGGPAAALLGLDVAVTKQVLDRVQAGIGIER